MNINDNEKEIYVIKQLYGYWKKSKKNNFIIECSIILPKLSENEIENILADLASKTFSISYQTVYATAGYDRYGKLEEGEAIPGRFHITLTNDFGSYALELMKTGRSRNDEIRFDKLSTDLFIGDKKVHFMKGKRRAMFMERIMTTKYRKKELSIDEDVVMILGDTLEGKLTSEIKTKYYVFFEEINNQIMKYSQISDFLKFGKNYCQINPKYLAKII